MTTGGGDDRVGEAQGHAMSAAPWRSATAQVLVEDVDSPELDRDAAHHLARVLRLRAGDEVCVTDGRGRWRLCRFDGSAGMDPATEVARDGGPRYPVTVAVALVKGGKPELVVQKLTELGVDRIVLFPAARSVVRWDPDRSAKQLDRLSRVAREACAQSRRLWLPEVELGTLDALLADGAVVADVGGRPLHRSDRTLLIGPEGGWADGELRRPDGEPVERVGLGDHVLRAETAAITAGALLTTLRAGVVTTLIG